QVQKRKIRSMAERAVSVNVELEDAIAHHLTDVERLLIGRNSDAVGIIEVVCHLDPVLRAGRQIKDLADHGCGTVNKMPEDGCVGAAARSDNNVVYSAIERVAFVIGIPALQLFAVEIELENGAVLVGAGQKK